MLFPSQQPTIVPASLPLGAAPGGLRVEAASPSISGMTIKPSKQFGTIIELACRLYDEGNADVLLVLLEDDLDWKPLEEAGKGRRLLVAADNDGQRRAAEQRGLALVSLDMPDSPVLEKIAKALLEGVSLDILKPSDKIVAVYSGFQAGSIDSVSFIRLDEHLGKLTARDLRRLETSVPLETLKLVIDLAVEIGREGREGKPVGTMFVVGDTRKVLGHSQPAGYDPMKGYVRKERDLHDPRVREAIKEVAQLDGAFVVSSDGVVERACRLITATQAALTLSKGLGSRHWAAAAISKITKAVAIVVSESSGTVRLFCNGEVLLRVEPLRRAMKWKDFEYEHPSEAPRPAKEPRPEPRAAGE